MNDNTVQRRISVLLILLLLLTGSCYRKEKEKIDVKPIIAFTHINMTHSFYKTWIHEQSRADFVYGMTSIHRDSGGSIEKQIRDIRSFIDQDVDLIVINPIDVIRIEEVVAEVIEAGIPCISSANIIDVPGVCNAILPEYDVMAEVAHFCAAYLGFQGNMLYMAGKSGNWASDHRLLGFQETIDQYQDITLLDSKDSNFEYMEAERIAEVWLALYNDIDMIIVNDDALALPLHSAVSRAGREDRIKIFSYTGEPWGVNAVKEGILIGNTLVSAERFAWWHTQLIQRMLKGERMEFAYMDVPIIIRQDSFDIVKVNGMYRLDDLHWITPDGALDAIKKSSLEFISY